MLILTFMLAIGAVGAVWGFAMCFLPNQWDRLTAAMSCGTLRSQPRARGVNSVIRLGNRIAGFAIFAAGSWFVYVAASEIYVVLSRPAKGLPAAGGLGETIPNGSTTPITVLSVFMLLVGLLMVMFPARSLTVLEHVWPTGMNVRPPDIPKMRLLIRICGIFFAFLAIMSLVR